MSERRIWTVEIAFTEDEDRTRADAWLRGGGRELSGWCRSRRNPSDPDVPLVGEELAAARALSDLSHKLVGAALDVIEELETSPERTTTEQLGSTTGAAGERSGA